MGEEKKQKNKTRPKNKMRQQQQKTIQTKPHATLSEFSLHLFIFFNSHVISRLAGKMSTQISECRCIQMGLE